MRSAAIAGFLLVLSSPALADATAAASCKAGLSPAGREIYDRSVAEGITAADGATVVKSVVEAMIGEGSLSMLQARREATAAGQCLKLLR
jgi:hypothetical protein